MKKIIVLIGVVFVAGLFFFQNNEKVVGVDMRSEEFKKEENAKIIKEVDASVSVDVVAKINSRKVDNLSDSKGSDEVLDKNDIEDVEKVVRGLSECILKQTCQDSKKDERYYDPENGTYHRSLVKSLDFLREQKENEEVISLGDKDLGDILNIKNDEVQASALLLADSLSLESLIQNTCSKVTDNNVLNILGLVAKTGQSVKLEECLSSFMQRRNTQVLMDIISFMSTFDISKDYISNTKTMFCPFLKAEEESQKRVGLKYRSILEKYELSCP